MAQIPQCTSPTSYNAPFCNRIVHIYDTKWCIVGNLSDAFCDLWDGSKVENKATINTFSSQYLQYIPRNMHTIRAFLCFIMAYYRLMLPKSFRVTSLALKQVYDCHNTGEVIRKKANESYGSIKKRIIWPQKARPGRLPLYKQQSWYISVHFELTNLGDEVGSDFLFLSFTAVHIPCAQLFKIIRLIINILWILLI